MNPPSPFPHLPLSPPPNPASPWSDTLRSLAADRRPPTSALLAATALLTLWIAWALCARLPIAVLSRSAHVESAAPTLLLAAPRDGWVVRSALRSPLAHVAAGQLLLELDTTDLTERRSTLAHRRAALRAERHALDDESAGTSDQLTAQALAHTATAAQALAAERQAESAAHLSAEASERAAALAHAGVIPAADAARSAAEAAQRRQALDAAHAALDAQRHQLTGAGAERRAALARLLERTAALAEQLVVLNAEDQHLASALARSSLRAPATGSVTLLATPAPGEHLASGAPLAWLAPPSALLQVRARFADPLAPHLRTGQLAYLSTTSALEASPTTCSAHLTAIAPPAAAKPTSLTPTASDEREATILLPPGAPFRLGDACQVEVEVAHLSPWHLLLRALSPSPQALPPA